MKKLLAIAIVIAACAALCAAVWPQNGEEGKVPARAENGGLNVYTGELPQPESRMNTAPSDSVVSMRMTESVMRDVDIISAGEENIVQSEPAPLDTAEPETHETPTAVIEPTPSPQGAPSSTDPYHTDVYPNNVYSEELIYDAGGNLIGKTITYPTTFGADTIWIDGHAYYDLPGFGLIEWSGPSKRIEDYTMYESGVKVGIMGGEDEAPVHSTSAVPSEMPEYTGEVIDQSVNARPEKNSTPPDYKPDTTPPEDPNARIIG